MNRDINDLKYLADLENPEDDNFVPADYNTQDMRNINEKVNRILYGDNGSNPSNSKEDEQVDISAGNKKSNELNSFSNPQKRQEFKKESADYLYSINNDNDYEKRKTKSSGKKKVIIGSVVVASLVLCATLVLVIQAVVMPKDNILADLGIISREEDPVVIENKSGEFIFARGCNVSGVDISGMTMEEAKKALEAKELEARPKMNITVTVDDDSTVFTENNFTFKYDTKDILEQEKELSESLAKGTTYPTKEDENNQEYIPEGRKSISATINKSSVKKLVRKLGKKYDEPAKDARVSSFNPDAKNMFTYEKGANGKELDEKSLKSKLDSLLESGAATGDYTGEVVENTVVTKPKATVNFLKKNIVRLAQWETYSTNDANGNQNMSVSLKACDGSVIEPGEQWSFNDCTGNSNDPANGYAPAGVIVNGSYTSGYGGGICQSSTTIYNAAVRSNIGIVERHPHTFPSSYAYSGFDAAIDYGNLDLKLQNNSDYQVFLSCYMSGSTLYATFYGVKSDFYDTIDTFSENYDITSSSYRSRAYRIYLDENGKEIDREELPLSYYSLSGGHSVQTADSGNGNYERGGSATGGERNVNENSQSNSSSVASEQSVAQPRTTTNNSSTQAVRQATQKPVTTKPQSAVSQVEVTTKPEAQVNSKPESSQVSQVQNEAAEDVEAEE